MRLEARYEYPPPPRPPPPTHSDNPFCNNCFCPPSTAHPTCCNFQTLSPYGFSNHQEPIWHPLWIQPFSSPSLPRKRCPVLPFIRGPRKKNNRDCIQLPTL